MTEKRFTFNVNKNTIEFDGKFKAYVNVVDGFRIANLLNVLHEENEQLKSDLRYWRTLAQSLAKKNNVGDFE